MSRRKRSPIREVIPDAKYNSVLVAKFINTVMLDGKKSVVEKTVYSAFDKIQEYSNKKSNENKSALEIFSFIIEKITPTIEVRARRIGGATYQIPTEVKSRRGQALALKWLVTAIRKQSGNLSNKIFKAFKEVLDNTGWAYKKKEEVFKMAEANKAFAHYAW